MSAKSSPCPRGSYVVSTGPELTACCDLKHKKGSRVHSSFSCVAEKLQKSNCVSLHFQLTVRKRICRFLKGPELAAGFIGQQVSASVATALRVKMIERLRPKTHQFFKRLPPNSLIDSFAATV